MHVETLHWQTEGVPDTDRTVLLKLHGVGTVQAYYLKGYWHHACLAIQLPQEVIGWAEMPRGPQ